VPRTNEIAPSECSDVEPSDAAPSAAATSSLLLSIIVRPTAAAAEESESVATEPAEPVSAHSSPAGRPTSLGGPGVDGPVDSSLVGVSSLAEELISFSTDMTGNLVQVVGHMQTQAEAQRAEAKQREEAQRAEAERREEARRVFSEPRL